MTKPHHAPPHFAMAALFGNLLGSPAPAGQEFPVPERKVSDIRLTRLPAQRRALAIQFKSLAVAQAEQPRFGGEVIVYAEMFRDSGGVDWTPLALFSTSRGAHVISMYRNGFLLAIAGDQLPVFAQIVQETETTSDRVDISRIKSIRFLSDADPLGGDPLETVWKEAPEIGSGRVLLLTFFPLHSPEAAEDLIRTFLAMRGDTILPPPPELLKLTDAISPGRPPLTVTATTDGINLAAEQYRQCRHASTVVIVRTLQAFRRLVASGIALRLSSPLSLGSRRR